MKHIRRISLIMVFAIIFTIGSVFAVWSYNRGTVSREGTYDLKMTDIVSLGKKGRIDATNNTLQFKVDDLGEVDWKAELVPVGDVIIKFVPAANSDEIVQDNGIKMRVTVSLSGGQEAYSAYVSDGNGGYTRQNVKILSLNPAGYSFDLNSGNATKEEVTITAEQIVSCLTFCDGIDVYLPTYEENVRFDNAMRQYIITITITEIE